MSVAKGCCPRSAAMSRTWRPENPAFAALYVSPMIVEPPVPERGDLYGLEVWQRIRHELPAQEAPSRSRWLTWNRLALAGPGLALCFVAALAFVAGRMWRPGPTAPLTSSTTVTPAAQASAAREARQRVLLASVAEHLDRSDRVLTDIMNAPAGVDISAEQRWAADLLTTSRLYRQDAVAACLPRSFQRRGIDVRSVGNDPRRRAPRPELADHVLDHEPQRQLRHQRRGSMRSGSAAGARHDTFCALWVQLPSHHRIPDMARGPCFLLLPIRHSH